MGDLHLLKNDTDWTKYLRELDYHSSYRHCFEPERFLCLVRSDFWDDPNGPFTYDHFFVYVEDVQELCRVASELELMKAVVDIN